MPTVSRRDFLKLTSAFLGANVFSSGLLNSGAAKAIDKPNIVVLVFDAMSVFNLSVYGYARNTTPNFERFAKRATVYHNHYATANFTSSGTASLLSGLYPWNHRAINLAGLIKRDEIGINIFSVLGKEYFSVGFSQNVWADNLLRQLQPKLDYQLKPSFSSLYPIRELFSEDTPLDKLSVYFAFDEFLSRTHAVVNPIPGSIGLGIFDSIYAEYQKLNQKENVSEEYPYGHSSNSYFFYYENKTVLAEIAQKIIELNQNKPFMGYFHFYAPHSPYTPHKDFVGIFEDMPFIKKPKHPLAYFDYPTRVMKKERDQYDEYIANIDAEFGHLIDRLEAAGVLENSYLVIASDHGEMFERGEAGHGTALLYEPVIRTPLIVSAPGQTERVDIHSITSNIDLLPTLAHLTQQPIPNGIDGKLLPNLGGQENLERAVFALEAKENSSHAPLTKATVAMRKGKYKLIYYIGYEKYADQFELFNLTNDPYELNNLMDIDLIAAAELKNELLAVLNQANQKY